MTEFYQGILAALSMLGGLCAFNYWMFGMMEKRLELKLDNMNADIHAIILEQSDQRKRTDDLYKILITLIEKGRK